MKDPLLTRADAIIEKARQLQFELTQQVALAEFICKQARQSEVLQSGLAPPLSISLMVAKGC